MPEDTTPTQRKNFRNLYAEAVAIGVANAAGAFLPVFLTRAGGTNFQVGLLTAMPAFTGLFLAIAMGSFLQSRPNVVPWYTGARLLIISSYAIVGVVSMIVPQEHIVQTTLFIRLMVTIPLALLNVAFSVVMNAVAGPRGRYAFMSRRWSILGLTTAFTVSVVGQILDRSRFPINYQVMFIGLSTVALFGVYYARRVKLPDTDPPPGAAGLRFAERVRNSIDLVRRERAFVSFTTKRFVYVMGTTLSAPLLPIYYVRQVEATDAWIGAISSIQTAVPLIGYYLWSRQGKQRGPRSVLLWTTLGLAVHPALIASTRRVELIALYAGLAAIFQAGLNLAFFDELMKTVPVQYSSIFVSVAQSLRFLPAMAAPLLGTLLADHVGIGTALVASSVLRIAGFGLFARGK